MERHQITRLLDAHRAELDHLGVESLSLFGSTARGEAGPDSDVDLLVEFRGRATFDRYIELRFLLQDVLGVEIDPVAHKALRPAMRPEVEREAVRVA